MSKIALVTDSTAYIPKDLVEKYHISVAPQVLIWGEETFRDGVDILPEEFYARLKNAKVMPSTSQATPGAFKQIYEDLLLKDYQILAVLISEKLSGTIASAIQAKSLFPKDAPIEIIDSTSTAMAMGFQVLMAARAVEQGATMGELKRMIEGIRHNTGAVFAVDTLEFLQRGGRIGKGTRFLGTALNIKPVLELKEGCIEPIERVRTRKRSLTRLIELIDERTAGKTPLRLATLHANAPEDARQLLAEMNGNFTVEESILAEVSPVVGTHAGPGTVGIAYMAGL